MRVKLVDLIKALDLEVLNEGGDIEKEIISEMISRPGLELTGYTDFFDSDRVMILGSKEQAYLNTLTEPVKKKRLINLLRENLPCIILSVNFEAKGLLTDLCKEKSITLFKSKLHTTQLYGQVYAYLRSKLAPRLNVHGVLMDIYGLGVLIIGRSGIGKSEVALELVRRNHILVADDRVDVYEIQPGTLVGEPPKILEKYIEIRGLGICDVVSLFGVAAHRENKRIRLVIELELWNSDKIYDRLGLDQEMISYFHTELPKNTIPILPGRTVATLVEAAALNQKQKYFGYNAVDHLMENINKEIKEKQAEMEKEESKRANKQK